MTWGAGLRTVALLRRIAKALERSNELAQERLALEHPEWGKARGLRRSSKVVDMVVATHADWNAKWRQEHDRD